MILALPSWAGAAEYWVATNGSNSNSCASAQNPSTPKLTIAAGVACLASGDTLIIKAGTYTAQEITNPPAGTASAYTIIKGDPSGARPVLLPNKAAFQRGFYCDRGETCKYIEMRYLEIRDSHKDVQLYGEPTRGFPHHFRIIDNYFFGGGVGFLIASSDTGNVGGDHLIQGNTFEQKGRSVPGYSPGINSIYGTGNRTIIENNTFDHCQIGVGIWLSTTHTSSGSANIQDVIIRNNVFKNMHLPEIDTWQQGMGLPTAIHVSVPGGGHQIYNNLIYHSGSIDTVRNTIWHGIFLNGPGLTKPVQVYNNTLYDFLDARSKSVWATEARCGPSQSLCVIRNNITYQAGAFFNGSLSNNLTTNPSFTNAATYDLTLASGSAAINAGTAAVGLPYCGSAPDIGAHETLAVTAASINGNTMDVTVCTAKPSVVPSGTWTPACTGTGCGTPVASSVSTAGGGLVRITVGGITGGACAAGQTWTISATGANTDSANIGVASERINQRLHTITNFPVNSSACTGGGGTPPPAAQSAEYRFENNLNDSSGNGNHAIGSANISYATAKDGLGVQFTTGVDSYVDTGLLNGHNPSTDHLVVAFGIRVPASDLGQGRTVAGTALGTNQRFFVRRDATNVWQMRIQGNPLLSSEFPVVAGDTHVCIKFNPTTDTATLHINGVAGTVAGASLHTYTSYTFASTFRFGLPSGFAAVTPSSSGPDIIDQAFIYTSDVSCATLYAAWNPTPAQSSVVQETHQWQGVYLLLNGLPENRGTTGSPRTIVHNGAATLLAQLKCTGGDCGSVQPRFRYNINGGAFSNVVPDTPTADGVAYWGDDASIQVNAGVADGPITGALTHTDGITALRSSAVPTIQMAQDTSYTIRGIFRITSAVGTVVCFKLYDQSGEALAAYTPTEGACLTVIEPRANAGP